MDIKKLILQATEQHEGLAKFLLEKGFDQAPASMRNHGAYAGGLADHSVKVMEHLVELTERLSLQWQNPRSPYLVGLLHDICKIDCYVWDNERQRYVWNKEAAKEHGEKSVALLSKYMELTEEEALCIRWHMGAFDKQDNWAAYGDAVSKWPNVLWTHTADMLAAKVDLI